MLIFNRLTGGFFMQKKTDDKIKCRPSFQLKKYGIMRTENTKLRFFISLYYLETI